MTGAPSFALQRAVFLALLGGMVAYAIVVAVVLQTNGGRGLAATPIELLDTIALAVGATNAVMALVLRAILAGKVAGTPHAGQPGARFAATLVPLAMLEGGCVLALTAWLLNGTMFPNLAVAVVLLLVALVGVPFTDPDANRG
jgi:hypothetical protein